MMRSRNVDGDVRRLIYVNFISASGEFAHYRGACSVCSAVRYRGSTRRGSIGQRMSDNSARFSGLLSFLVLRCELARSFTWYITQYEIFDGLGPVGFEGSLYAVFQNLHFTTLH